MAPRAMLRQAQHDKNPNAVAKPDVTPKPDVVTNLNVTPKPDVATNLNVTLSLSKGGSPC